MLAYVLSIVTCLASAGPIPAAQQAGVAPGNPSPSARPAGAGVVSRIGGFLPAGAGFGWAVTALGDVDDDGNHDIAVSATGESGGTIYIVFLDEHRRVRDTQAIPASVVGAFADFSYALCGVGDLDGDGVEDLATSEPLENNVWIFFLDTDGSVLGTKRTSDGLPIPPMGGAFDSYGEGLASLGDFDGDGIGDLLIASGVGGADGSNPRFFVTFLNTDGSVKGFFESSIGHSGPSCGVLGDLDGNGRREIAIGDGFNGSRLRTHRLNANGSVQSTNLVQGTHRFGRSIVGTHDMDHDGVPDMVVGAPGFATLHGAYHRVLLNANGTEKARTLVAGPAGNAALLDPFDHFGAGIAYLGDPDGDGVRELAVGAPGDDKGALNAGCVWILELP